MTLAQVSSLSSIAKDPLRDFKFDVLIVPNGSDKSLSTIHLGFLSVSGLGLVSDVISYRGGGMNISTQNMPGQISFTPLILTRGITLNSSQPQIDWMKQLFSIIQGSGAGITTSSDFRATIYIYVIDHPSTGPLALEQAGFKLYNAWPYTISYGNLDAGSNQLFIYNMTLVFEGFDTAVGQTDVDALAGGS